MAFEIIHISSPTPSGLSARYTEVSVRVTDTTPQTAVTLPGLPETINLTADATTLTVEVDTLFTETGVNVISIETDAPTDFPTIGASDIAVTGTFAYPLVMTFKLAVLSRQD